MNARQWEGKTIQLHEFEDGSVQKGVNHRDIADLRAMLPGARMRTKLFNVPDSDSTPVFEAPGSVYYENSLGGRVISMAQNAPEQIVPYYSAALVSESYREEVVKWLCELGGGIPGGARYLGVGPVTCEAGTTDADGNVFVLNSMNLDGDDTPEMAFDTDPSSVERLAGDGSWKKVEFARTGNGRVRIASPVATQRPAIFRWR